MEAIKMEPFDALQTPLDRLSLIEAGAGTGKTYTITSLYLRLILEAQRSVDQILVVTYTKAATAELRDRIRHRLSKAREAFLNGQDQNQDKFHDTLLKRVCDHPWAIRRLTDAMHDLDEAAVFTIHGFCQRVLADYAFESAMPFETEVLADEGAILREIVEDFWRKTFYEASPLFTDYALAKGFWPDNLYAMVRPLIGKPYLEIPRYHSTADFTDLEQDVCERYKQAQNAWQSSRQAVAECLINNKGLNGNKYRQASIPLWLTAMDEYLSSPRTPVGLFEKFEKFTSRHLATSVKKGARPPEHRFFTICDELKTVAEELAASYDRTLDALQCELIDYANRELAPRKQPQQLQSYNDLLINLQKALQAAQGNQLAEAVRRQYSAALIDEFQDTDPIQYSIFRRLYIGSGLPVFFVGDPKQAIYSFRGADVFEYIKGRADAQRRYTLDTNWRSVPDLIGAVNTLFGYTVNPFFFKEIVFHNALPAPSKRVSLKIKGVQAAPFHIWFMGSDEAGKPVNKGLASEKSAQATAGEIARLLNLGSQGEASIGDRPLAGGDIAILVRSHLQGQRVRRALQEQHIPSVQHVQDNVFDSREAMEIERVLLAIAAPEREPLVKAALATELFGMKADELFRITQDNRKWESFLEKFQHWQLLWRERGFIRMFREMLVAKNVYQRLLVLPEGERRLTNFLHIAELLQHATVRGHLGVDTLIKWLAERRQARDVDDEVEQLRLESDENLVKIVTVHRSKGLQYPVVFCPYLWDGKLHTAGKTADIISYHDPERENTPTVALGSAVTEEAREQAKSEELAENLRLMYVALTRAQYRCYLVWGAIKDAGSSPLAWLLYATSQQTSDPSIQAVAKRLKGINDDGLMNDLTKLSEQARGAIHITALPEWNGEVFRPPVAETALPTVRDFKGRITACWRITSFSALATGHGAETPDYDASSIEELHVSEIRDQADIFSFPRGARPGECLHAIFERLDFRENKRGEIEIIVTKALDEYGFGAHWTPVVTDMVFKVLATPLDNERRLSLRDIALDHRLNELEFYYPIARLESHKLRALLVAHHFAGETVLNEQVEDLDFQPASGYLKGFIDLIFEAGGIFYLADYKSNWLGHDPRAYGESRLPAVMARESYYLQYLLYTVAVHRHLRQKMTGYDYDQHFGGVFYLFLRGMDPALGPAFGIFRDRPSKKLVQALDDYMATGSLGIPT